MIIREDHAYGARSEIGGMSLIAVQPLSSERLFDTSRHRIRRQRVHQADVFQAESPFLAGRRSVRAGARAQSIKHYNAFFFYPRAILKPMEVLEFRGKTLSKRAVGKVLLPTGLARGAQTSGKISIP